MEKRLEVKNLSRAFNNKEVLKDISFSLYTNEVVALVGGNGAGKSTLLDIVGKVSDKYKGSVDYLGLKDDEIGVMFQSSSFPSGIKVKHLVQFAIKTHKLKENERSRINELIKTLNPDNKEKNKEGLAKERGMFNKNIKALTVKYDIDGLMNKSSNRLSGGERQRVNLFLSMIHEPKVLFLDEPTAGLDIESKNLLMKILKQEIKDRKLTVVIVTHEMAVIESIVKRIIILKNGVIAFDEPIKEFKGKYKTIDKAIEVQVFGGDK